MNRVDEFITQGLLPFVGREDESQKILDFWRSVPDAQRLRVMLLTAEAGVGKSRLLDECLRAIRDERGAVVHVKLYPEAAISLAALVSRSLWTSSAGRTILRAQPGENLPEVVAGLQRLSRLRPTLLVLEDVHLFPSESIPDLARLFDALVDETISVLCLSRPASFAAQGVLERYLVESLTMEGLAPEALERLWHELFGSRPADEVVTRLHAVTRGNALAIRSALRGVIQSGALQRTHRAGEWKLSVPLNAFEQTLQRSVSLVVEGMVVHLDREKREAAELLATLGEVFGRETAAGLDARAEGFLNDLIEQGIIVETVHPVSPLAGLPVREPGKSFVFMFPQSDYPLLAFTHTLLHDYLSDRARPDLPALLGIVAGDYPLYSLLPFRRLETIPLSPDPEVETVALVVRRLLAIAQSLDRTAQWRDATELLRPLNRLLEYLENDPRPSDEEKLRWRMHIQHASLSILRRSMHSPEWIALHEGQLTTTRNVDTYEGAQYRLLAKSFELWRIGIDMEYDAMRGIHDEVTGIVERYPELETDIAYIYALESLVEKAYANGDYDTMRLIHRTARDLLASPDLPVGTRHTLVERILPNLLRFFETPEELCEREESIRLIEEYRPEDDAYYGTIKVEFHVLTGRLHDAFVLSESVIRNTRERGLWTSGTSVHDSRVISGAGIGYSIPRLLEESHALLKAAGESDEHETLMQSTATTCISLGLLSGRVEESIEWAVAFHSDVLAQPSAFRAMIRLWQGHVDEFRATQTDAFLSRMYFSRPVVIGWKRLADMEPGEAAERRDEILAELLALLDYPIIHMFDVLNAWGTLHLWRTLAGPSVPDVLKESLIQASVRALEWLEERGVGRFMEPLIALLEELDETTRAKEWEARVRNLEAFAPEESMPDRSAGSIRISMLGTIRVAMPDDDFAPIRGVRIRTLLGLMVADRMVGTPLSPEEFQSLAGGEESDPEHARKKKNMAVVRLREIVGHDAVLTDGPTPQLNLELVSVDLLEIDDLIRRALEAARQEAFVRALPLIEVALNRYHGEVPFPTLYENFFEAARDDFEHRLRQAIVEIGRGMIAMEDAGGAEPFLRKAFESLPGDEEIADLLRTALIGTGNRIEAERVRMQMQIQK